MASDQTPPDNPPIAQAWDGYVAGSITCDCGHATRFMARQDATPVHCLNCGKTWLFIWQAAVVFQNYGAGAPPGKGDVQEC